jgi:hypothetical protein
LKLYTDVAGSLGFAGVLGSQWFAHEWPPSLHEMQIVIRELFSIVLALELQGDTLNN